MKKLIFALLLSLLLISSQRNSLTALNAKADEVYAMVTSDFTPFYSDAGCQMIKFYLPYSYFVKIVSIGNDFTRVLYKDEDPTHPSCEGYVSNADLNFSITPTSSPYPNVILTLETDEVIFSDSKKSQPKTVLMSGAKATYYGNITIGGEAYVYVYSGGHIGYARKSAFNEYTLPLHPDEQLLHVQVDKPISSQDEVASPPEGENSLLDNPMKVVIVFVVLIASLCLIFLILKPNAQTATEHSFFNDNDD